MAKITTTIARNIQQCGFLKMVLLIVLCLAGLAPLLLYRRHVSRSLHRNVDPLVIVGKSEDHDVVHVAQANTTSAMTKTNTTSAVTKTTRHALDVHQHHLDRPMSNLNVSEMTNLDAMFERLVIVTATSDNHMKEALGMIASAQRFMPHTPIYLYDLGLKSENHQKLSSLCGVKVRGFDFSKYPPHVKFLHTYTWKVIIMRETLKEFGVIFYGDSSVRFEGTLRSVFPLVRRNDGYICHIHGFDPKVTQQIQHQYFFTHRDMFAELGVDREEYFNSKMAAPHISAGRVLMANNTVIWEKILDPLLECAMRRECIAPLGSKYGTHRFDASALAILVYKNLRYRWTEENNATKEFDAIVKIVRKGGGAGLKYCLKNDTG